MNLRSLALPEVTSTPHSRHLLPDLALLALLLLCAGALAVVFWPFITGARLYLFLDIGSDTYNQFFPALIHAARYLRTEGIPFWSFAAGMGQNIFPGGLQDPFSLIPILAGPKAIPFLFAPMEMLKIALSAVVALIFLRRRGISATAAIGGALCLALSGCMIIGSGWYGHSTTVLYGIILLLALDNSALRKDNRLLTVAFFLLATRSAFYIYLFGLFATLYYLFRLAEQTDKRRVRWPQECAKALLYGLCGVAVAAVFLIPDITRLLESPRFSKGMPLDNAVALKRGQIDWFSLPQSAIALLRAVSSNLSGTGSNHTGWGNYLEAPALFCGVGMLLMLPFSFAGRSKKQRLLHLCWFGLWLLIVLLPPLRMGMHLFAGDYFKGGFSFFVTTVLWLGGVRGFDRLRHGYRPNCLVVIGCAAALVLLIHGAQLMDPTLLIDSDLLTSLYGLIAIWTVLLCTWNRRGVHRPLSMGGALLLLILDLTSQAWLTVNKRDTLTSRQLAEPIGYNDPTAELLESVKDTVPAFFRVSKDYSSGIAMHTSFNDAQAQGYFGTPSYNSLNHPGYIAFLSQMGIISATNETQTRWAPGVQGYPLLETVFNVRYGLSSREFPYYMAAGYEPIAQRQNVRLFRNRFALPLGYTYNQWIPVDRLVNLPVMARQVALLRACALEQWPVSPALRVHVARESAAYTLDSLSHDWSKLRHDTLALSSFSNNRISGSITCAAPRLLFFSIPFDRGWHATINGEPARLLRAAIGFTALELTPGTAAVELRYRMPLLRTGIGISLGALMLAALLWRRQEHR